MPWDFAKSKEVDSIDKVPEDYRSFYVEEGDKHKLSDNITVQAAVKVIAGQQRALIAARSEAADAKKRIPDMSLLSEWGDNPAEIAESVTTKLTEAEAEVAKGKGASLDLERVKASLKESMTKAFDKERKTFDVKETALTGQLRQHLVKNVATAAIVSAGGNPKLLMPLIEKSVKAIADDKGNYQVFVLGEDGEPRYGGVTGEHMTIVEFVSEMKADSDYGLLFKSEAASGGGAPPSGGAKPPKRGAVLSPVDKIALGMRKKQFVKD